ncbi:MAG: type II secretion system protein [Candidatus Pacebacteria bacterium]|nr:type II secretion system protein [Candidatus Paceibacterota bacterium]
MSEEIKIKENTDINMNKKSKTKGFTLIELLVVVAIIGLLSSIVSLSLKTAREKARDINRLSDMKQIQLALEFYYDKYGTYPGNNDNDNGGWDTGCFGAGDSFISSLETNDFISKTPCDPTITSQNGGYAYYRYGPQAGCPGSFYVLGVRNMETSGNPYPGSPGWRCTNRNWQGEFDWVTGKFEK